MKKVLISAAYAVGSLYLAAYIISATNPYTWHYAIDVSLLLVNIGAGLVYTLHHLSSYK